MRRILLHGGAAARRRAELAFVGNEPRLMLASSRLFNEVEVEEEKEETSRARLRERATDGSRSTSAVLPPRVEEENPRSQLHERECARTSYYFPSTYRPAAKGSIGVHA